MEVRRYTKRLLDEVAWIYEDEGNMKKLKQEMDEIKRCFSYRKGFVVLKHRVMYQTGVEVRYRGQVHGQKVQGLY